MTNSPPTNRLRALIRRRRAVLGHQPTVVIYNETAEQDLFVHRAAGRIGPDTIIVEIMRFGNKPRPTDAA
jgi:hypothetical protein